MKVNKFDYNTKKEIFFDVFSDVRNDCKVYDNSFSNGLYHYSNDKIDEQIYIFETLAEASGLNIHDFIIEYKEIIYNDLDFTSNSGFIDALLYKYDKKLCVLAGYNLKNDCTSEEYYFKYSYGYYKYDMGKNFILQAYDTIEDYFKDTAKLFLPGFFESMYGTDEKEVIKNQIIKEYNGGYVIFCNLENLFISCNERYYDRFINDIKNDIEKTVQYFDIINDIMIITINLDKFNINEIDFDDILEEFDTINQSHKYNL